MKIFIRTGLIMLMSGISSGLFAQKQLTEGMLSYTITISSSKGAAPVSNALNGAEVDLYLKGTQSRTEMKSTLGTETTVYDNKAAKGFILKEYSGQKLMISVTKENWLQKNQRNDNIKFQVSNEQTVVAGYNCKKATGTSDGKTFTIYFTPDLVAANKQYNNSFPQLPGLPVQYEVQSGDLIFKYTLTKISYDPVAASKFDTPKTGFRTMTYDENQQLRKGSK
jgi:GLPGLI family protein